MSNTSEYNKKYWNLRKKKILEKRKLPENRKKSYEYLKSWVYKNRDKFNSYSRKYRLKNRVLVIDKYGGKCFCCKERRFEFLALDHIRGGGRKHLKSIGYAIVPWIIKNRFPKGFRILCHNCNMALGIYGHCPHKNTAS